MNERILEQIGLTKGEIKVYFTLLKIGETTTGRIIEEAQISSGKIYEILEKLAKKGLVSYIIKGKTKFFSPASPNRIIDYINEKKDELKERERVILREIPSFIAIENNRKDKKETHLYEGIKGIQTAVFEALENLTSKDEILAMGIHSSKEENFNLLWKNWHKKRISKKIICKAIFSDNNNEYYDSFKVMKNTYVKVLNGVTPAAIDIMGSKVLIFSYGEKPSCLVISNSEIAKSFTTFFDTLWKIARK